MVLGLIALLMGWTGCTFDGAGLESRRCLDNEGCLEGLTCLGGFCQDVGTKPAATNNGDPFRPDGDAGTDDATDPGPCGEAPVNACGGCELLDSRPGAPCGECEDGVQACQDGQLSCEGATGKRVFLLDADGDGFGVDGMSIVACAATGVYRVDRGGDCDDSSGDVHPNATEVCDGADNNCDDAVDEGVTNGCDGCDALAETLGQPCGFDGSGQWSCAGRNSVQCVGANLNACGGSSVLGQLPGAACGTCGEVRCDGQEAVRCIDPGANTCGGCNTLANMPGTLCGACGERVCDGMDATRCEGDVPNACGGCGTLANTPGTACSTCGRWTCDATNADLVTCPDIATNACGGCGELGGAPGDPCGPCGLDALACQGQSLVCDGNTACDPLWRRVDPQPYRMGSPANEPGRNNTAGAETQHQVTLTRTYLVAVIELTQSQWTSLMSSSGTAYTACELCPVDNITWMESVQYANALSEALGFAPCYTIRTTSTPANRGVDWDVNCTGFRLPTEAEWEYAARGGTTTAVFNGNIALDTFNGCIYDTTDHIYNIAWTCIDGRTSPNEVVTMVAPNPFGLYDTSGNVAEWVYDIWGLYPDGPVTDPLSSPNNRCETVTSDCFHVARGGSFRDGADKVRSAARESLDGRLRHGRVGLRLVRTLTP